MDAFSELVQQWLPDPMELFQEIKSWMVSWRGVVLILVLTNLKSMPGGWTVKVWYTLLTSFFAQMRKLKQDPENEFRMLIDVTRSSPDEPISKHPLFKPDTIVTHASLPEIDYNLHKSNSTYFADLDISRSKVMGRLLAPVWPFNTLEFEVDPSRTGSKSGESSTDTPGTVRRQRLKGNASVILGAVHASFRKEIAPMVKYKVQSRVLSWDRKWIYIVSWFHEIDSKPDQKPKIFASCLSKYVVKKDRITVRPDAFFTEAGLLPPRPENASPLTVTPPSGKAKSTAVDTAKDASQRAAKAVAKAAASDSAKSENALGDTWSWQEIENERLRGWDLVSKWAVLDEELDAEFMH